MSLPSRSAPNLFAIGSFIVAITIILDAFAAHGLKHHLDAYSLEVFYTATRYQFVHSLVLLTLDGTRRIDDTAKRRVLSFFLLGTLLFSGSLYALSLTGMKWLGMITPLGGISFIAGWIFLGFSASKKASGP